jgi:hypothetical protein
MDNIYCVGGEKNLTDCRFDGWGINDCQESEAAGVICQVGPVSRLSPPLISESSTVTTTSMPATTTSASVSTSTAIPTTVQSGRQSNLAKKLQQDMAPKMRIKVGFKI